MRYNSADPGIIVSGLTKPFVLTERKWHDGAEVLAQAYHWHTYYPDLNMKYSRNSLIHYAKLWYASFPGGNLNLKGNISYNYRGLLRASGILVPSKRKSTEHEFIEQPTLAPLHSSQSLVPLPLVRLSRAISGLFRCGLRSPGVRPLTKLPQPHFALVSSVHNTIRVADGDFVFRVGMAYKPCYDLARMWSGNNKSSKTGLESFS